MTFSNPLCKYKDIFGKPGTGGHSFKIYKFSVVDILLTIIGAVMIAFFFKLPYLQTIIAMFLLGILLHRLFCVRTTLDKLLFE